MTYNNASPLALLGTEAAPLMAVLTQQHIWAITCCGGLSPIGEYQWAVDPRIDTHALSYAAYLSAN